MTKNFLKLFSPQTSAALVSRRVKNAELEKFARGRFGIIAVSGRIIDLDLLFNIVKETTMHLHEIWPGKMRGQIYCGPSVVCALTGCEGHEARTWINETRGRAANAPVMGLSNSDLIKTLDRIGYVTVSMRLDNIKTLADFAMSVEGMPKFYIVNVTGHYVSLCQGRVADNHIRFGCPVAEHPSRRQHVKKAWWVAEKVRRAA